MKKPVRLEKKNEKSFDWTEIPLEYIAITAIGILFLLLIIAFIGSCTESGLVYNQAMA